MYSIDVENRLPEGWKCPEKFEIKILNNNMGSAVPNPQRKKRSDQDLVGMNSTQICISPDLNMIA